MTQITICINPDLCTGLVKKLLQDTVNLASSLGSEFIVPEHLLYCITKQEEFKKLCEIKQMSGICIIDSLEGFFCSMDKANDGEMPSLSLGFIELIDNIQKEADKTKDPICVPNFLSAMTEQEESFAGYVIQSNLGEYVEMWLDDAYQCYMDDIDEYFNKKEKLDDDLSNLSQDEVFNKLMSHAGKLFDSINNLNPKGKMFDEEKKKEPWEKMLTNLSETYKNKNELIGREDELDATIQVLCQKDKNNPLHIGEAGVGKTALVYGLAKRIDEGNVPPALQGFQIYMLDMGTLVAGASYHGEFEKRMKDILDGMKNRGKCICYIDEIHNIMGTGGSGNSSMDASNMLKPYLEDGTIRFIGSTTYQEYNRYMAKSKGIVRRFQQIDILEPSVDDTIKILEGIIGEYEAHHKVKYEHDALVYAVEQSNRLIADRFLPDKAISILDRAGAYRQTHPLLNKKNEPKSAGRQKVDKKLVGDIISKVCKINAKALTEDTNVELKNLSERIGAEIYGQQEAIDKVVRAVKMSKAGLTFGEKPIASLLFVGPTGVGKTEVCKVLAKELGIELVRFDMSEYTEKHAVAKLIGSPAGYVGYDDGGLLTDAIRKSPNCVLLLDEIEKAHSDIYNILLQVMDYANLTDNKGNKVDFRNVILVMTSNAGAQFAGQASVGFSGGISRGDAMMQTVKKTFKPEFLNRLSGTVVFHDMDEKMASLILDKKIRQLSSLLSKKNVCLSLEEDARTLLLQKGYTRQYGAREMDRVIQNMLTPLLIDEILFGRLKNGGNVSIMREGDGLRIK